MNTEDAIGPAYDSWKQPFLMIMKHFLANGDEECVQASDGQLKVLGDKERRKHEKNVDDSRISMTIYRTGTGGGTNGPSASVMGGDKLREGYTDAFLVRNGSAEGSCLVMTPTAFMTIEAWREITPKITAGLRMLPHVRDHPDWWMFKSLDGFGPHVNDLEAMQIYHDHKIAVAKEEGDSSLCNQPFDRDVALKDKAQAREILALLRSTTTITRGVISQWDLVHVGLAMVRQSGEPWETSFKMTNLHPETRLPFEQWIQKIKPMVQGGSSFQADTLQPAGKFWMLPTFWLGMEPGERRDVIKMIDSHDSKYTVSCLRLLHEAYHIPLADMNKIRVCYSVSKEHPETMELTMESQPSATCQTATDVAVAPTINDGLISFQRCPKGYTGQKLLDHMTMYIKRRVKKGERVRPSAHLNVEMSPE